MASKIFSSMMLASSLLGSAWAAVDLAAVGASTTLDTKAAVMCSVLDYGAVADGETDIGPAISSAFTECVSGNAATLYVPEGNYSMSTGVTLSGASGWAFQLDGLITLTTDGDFGGNAIVIENGDDIEFFSSNNLGAINGQGYVMRRDGTDQNARLLRFISVSNLSVHNVILIDSPVFHLIFNEVSNLDCYYITIRGADVGATDGIDLICTDNCHIHDFEVTNRDECVSVKTPSNNVLIEDAYCNHSGGMSIGSLDADITDSADAAAVSNITMRNIYSYKSTSILLIKTWPGGDGATGYVKDSVFENFWSYDCTYGLDIDQYWYSVTTPNTGAVALSGLTFSNWTGHVDNGVSRGPIVIRGSDQVPLQDITITDFDLWTLNGDTVVNQCKNVYGDGYCINTADASSTYTTSVTSTVTPAAYTSPAAPTWGVEGYGSTIPIPVYSPSIWWPTASGAVAVAAAAPTSAVATSAAAVVASSVAVAGSSPASAVSVATSAAVIVAASSSAEVIAPVESVTAAAAATTITEITPAAASTTPVAPTTTMVAIVSSVTTVEVATTIVATSADATTIETTTAATTSAARKGRHGWGHGRHGSWGNGRI